MKVVYILFAFCIIAAHCEDDFAPKEDEADFEKEFHELSPKGDKKLKDEEDEALKEAEDDINKENEEYKEGKASFEEKLNDMSDMPKEEFEREKEGIIPPKDRAFVGDRINGVFMPDEATINDPENRAKLDQLYADLDREDTPASFDARAQGLTTVAKNQQSCGSCAAFGATGLHETCMLKAGAKKEGLDLAEQYIIDCGFDGNAMNACNGASPDAYTVWFGKHGGVAPHEAEMPYKDRNPAKKCPSGVKTWNSGAKVSNVVYDYDCNADKMKKLVAKYGAVMIAAYASDAGFSNYAKGVFTGCTKTSINHALLVVGYGNENGKDYWIVKNSWGNTWGEKGFAKIERGKNACGMEGICVIADCSNTGVADVAPTTPKPKPIPAALFCDITDYYGPGITGTYNLNGEIDGKPTTALVKCNNSKCTPKNPGPSNACMYICGKTKCTWE